MFTGSYGRCRSGFEPRSRFGSRRGAILVLAAFLMVFMMGVLALTVDLGYMMTVDVEMKRATDAAALAGAGGLLDGPEEAEVQAFEYLARNPVGGRIYSAEDSQGNVVLPSDAGWISYAPGLLDQNRENFEVELGHWNSDSRTFLASDHLPSAVRVFAQHKGAPLFFAKVFGRDRFDVSAESIARYQPRDISLVLDFSASMCYDSQLRRIIEYGESNRPMIEGNLLEIYQDLGSPSYGNLPFTPQYLTIVGQAASGCVPQCSVTFRSDDVYVTSTKDLSNVVLGFSDGSKQKFEGLHGYTGSFRGTGGNYNKRIDKVWVKSGCNSSGDGPGYGERFEDNTDTIKKVFGLNNVPYPYPSGSWNDYISYAKTSSYVKGSGYGKKYGFLTLINYWLEKKTGYNETPDLWKTRAQPVDAVKDAVGVFLDYVREVDCDDRVALGIYNSPDQTGLLEHALTENFDAIEDIVTHRQAGHYDRYTNIGAGIQKGRVELDSHARVGAFKMIILMTDGNANRPTNEREGREFALEQARLAAEKRYPIFTISLGIDADTELMEEIAEITKGVHFNIPGGQAVQNYADELQEVFRRIADDRPLILVK